MISFDTGVTFDGHGVFMLTGRASSTAGVSGIEASAQVDGALQDLGAATLNGDGRFTFIDTVGAALQTFISATETDGAGVQATVGAHMSLIAGIAGEPYAAQQDSYPSSTCSSDTAHPTRPSCSSPTAGSTWCCGSGSTAPITTRIGLSSAEFGGSIAEVLRNARDAAGGALIVDPTTGDAVKLVGISKARLVHNRGDFALHA